MSVFTQEINPITGSEDCFFRNKNYDHHQEVARSGFADMLHDKERNQKYEQALASAINKMHEAGKKANVLDIGTGTGLLSMMAARNGADSIIACEAFEPMSECAKKIVALNGFQDKIKIIPKMSTSLKVGETGDLKEKCNILVTEVFDTELIGEGALLTFSHALTYLLEKDSIVIPESATVYAQVVECPLAQSWNKMKDIFDNDGEPLLSVPKSVKKCLGSAAVHDIQLNQLPVNSFNTIISPQPVLKFDWSGRNRLNFTQRNIESFRCERDGIAQVVFMWWELQMDTEGKIILSCAPHWAHPDAKGSENVEIPWRDHWMQAVYFLPYELNVKKDQEVHLVSCHDRYSLWFYLNAKLSRTDVTVQPACSCALHDCFSRTRIGQMNDSKRHKKYLSLFERYVNKESVVFIVTEAFYFGLCVAKLAKKVYVTERNHISRQIMKDYIKENDLKNVVIVPELLMVPDMDVSDVNVVLCEPYFMNSILPWDNLLTMNLVKFVKLFFPVDIQIFPKKAAIKAVAVRFTDLYKICSPLGTCEGFRMDEFDRLIAESRDISDEKVEAQPLWEYPGIALTEAKEIVEIDLIDTPKTILKVKGTLELQGDKRCNGIAFWVDWDLDGTPSNIISTGPTTPIQIGQKIEWDMHTRQGVYLFPKEVTENIKYELTFDKVGEITFSCI